jgi:hypothetical protein
MLLMNIFRKKREDISDLKRLKRYIGEVVKLLDNGDFSDEQLADIFEAEARKIRGG